MKTKINYTNLNTSERLTQSETIDLVDTCPHCLRCGEPIVLNASLSYVRNLNILSVNCFCSQCRNTFIATFIRRDINQYVEFKTYPSTTHKVILPSNIVSLYPDFCEIYKQASEADDEGLNLISGVGYRKSLEFIIKFYAISKHPNCEETISVMPLAKCIEDYIDNKHIQILAKASAWLGNDETHFVRKHESYNVEDLKRFLKAIISFIDSEIEAEKALTMIESPIK